MSRNLFDDIFERLGMKASLYPQEMDEVAPKPGSILGGFDYRRPFDNAGLANATLAQTDTGFAPPMNHNDIWRAKALSAEYAPKPLGPGFGTVPSYQGQMAEPFARDTQQGGMPLDPEVARANLRDASSHLDQPPETVQPNPIPQSYFDVPKPPALERAGQYIGDASDAFVRATANNIVPSLDAGDRFAAGMGALTGIDGNQGDYVGNLKRQRTNSELAEISSPIATAIGVGAGSLLGSRLLRAAPTLQGAIRSTLKDRPLPPTPPRGIPLRPPSKPRGRFNDY